MANEEKCCRDKGEAGAKKEKGAKLTCDVCGMVVAVEDPCGCDDCDLLCCDRPMRETSCCA